MKFNSTPISGLYVAELTPHIDARGYFVRAFCQDELKKIGLHKKIVQINHSKTARLGALRGMHFQVPPYAETKLVRCITGKVFDVAIDIRSGSETFLHWYGEYLTEDNFKMMIIPEGFAHGFQVIEPDSELLYFHTAEYAPNSESGILYNDANVGIEWPLGVADLSERDMKHTPIDENFFGVKL